ncbi:unnamed protein product, partial [Nippostrongylus brasiliensis]|uniref:SRP40_C domain-containing protein n=1 Tax=Nippostrongylus brasiliensis TaxID=27835 RepID=A0A0N4YR76_NIPBR
IAFFSNERFFQIAIVNYVICCSIVCVFTLCADPPPQYEFENEDSEEENSEPREPRPRKKKKKKSRVQPRKRRPPLAAPRKKEDDESSKSSSAPRGKQPRGAAPMKIRPPADTRMRGTHDPNYQTLVGLNNDEVFKPKDGGRGGGEMKIKAPENRFKKVATFDPNYQTLAGMKNEDVFKSKTLANISPDVFGEDKKKKGGGRFKSKEYKDDRDFETY